MKESEDYNFQTCVKTSLAEKVGCRPPWDSWSPASSPLCARVEDMARHEEYDWDLYNFEQKIVLNFTGCKVLSAHNLYLEYPYLKLHFILKRHFLMTYRLFPVLAFLGV